MLSFGSKSNRGGFIFYTDIFIFPLKTDTRLLKVNLSIWYINGHYLSFNNYKFLFGYVDVYREINKFELK